MIQISELSESRDNMAGLTYWRASPPGKTRIYYYFILYNQFSFRSEHQIKSLVRTEEHSRTRERREAKWLRCR